MGRKDDSKIRIIAVYRMMESGRKMSSKQIMNKLERIYGIACDRKTIFDDLMAIDRFIQIKVSYGRNGGYEKFSME